MLNLVIWEDFIDAMSKDGLQKEYNKAMQESDIFVMLFFTKVGKYTLEEFENAFGYFKKHGWPLVYTYFKTATINTDSLNRQDVNSLLDFQDKLKNLKHYTSKYSDINDLKYQFTHQLDKLLPRQFTAAPSAIDTQTTPKTDIYHLPRPSTKLAGRTKELKKIQTAFNDYNTHIFAIIAAGGIGKSALIDEWLDQLLNKRLKTKNRKPNPLSTRENSESETGKDKEIERVFGWSFYSQGSHNTQTSSAQFFEQALFFLGPFWDYDLKKKPLTDDTAKGRRLAALLRARPSLLILDGLEPLQNKVLVDGGRLKDIALAALLWDVERNGLAKDSLIIISSRQPIVELSNSSHYQSLDLQRLSTSDGVKLLKSLNIKGLQNELEKAVEAYGGHALALVLLGRLLKEFFQGDVNKHEQLPLLQETNNVEQGRHAERVMSFYDNYWGQSKRGLWQKLRLSKAKLEPEQIFLRLLGLFDRPMDENSLNALLEKSQFAKPLAKLSEKDWNAMLNNLHKMALLPKNTPHPDNAPTPKNTTAPNCQLSIINYQLNYDTHPLIRTYFGNQFQKQNPADWKQAHLILFEYFQTVPEKDQPDTLEQLEPLYRAVVHGCLAGEYQKALDDVYNDRILRSGKEAYSLHKLGAYAQDLTAIAAFFPEGWDKPVSQGLSEANQAWLLAVASFCLMSLGRLSEAVKPRQVGLIIEKNRKDWKNAAITAENLVDLLLPLGRLTEAKDAAEKAIVFADRTDDKFDQMTSLSKLAIILHRHGDLNAALKEFKQAEEIQKEFQPEYHRLCSLWGAQYCALLLDMATDRTALEEVLERGLTTLKWAMDNNVSSLDIAFNHLTIARALFRLNRFDEAKEEFDQAVAGIRKAGSIDDMPVFLLERAKFLCHQKDFEQSRADLDEAQEIITRCGMKLYAVDAALLQAKLNLEQNKDAQAEYELAEKLIQESGYHLRDGELKDLEFLIFEL